MTTLVLGTGFVITASELVALLKAIGITATIVAAGLWYEGREHSLEEVKRDITKRKGGCLKCFTCKKFKWNAVSAANKAVGIIKGGGYNAEVDAYRNCTCGHHKNYHVS